MKRTLHTLLAALAGCIVSATNAHGQVVLNEQFTGGSSTTGFTVESAPDSDCEWTFAPGDLTDLTFSVDGSGVLPSGGGFDGDFAFLDSDACGTSGITVNSWLVSPTFDASDADILVLSFSHQFYARLASFCKVEVYNGSAWSEIVTYTEVNVGYPNPAQVASFDITDAAGGSSVAQVRFQFNSGWDWWWALDDIKVENVACFYPSGLAANNPGNAGATITFTDNGSPSYEWVVTAGDIPDGTNALASGTAPNTNASGLQPGTPYTVFVRSVCAGGGFSVWSPGVGFVTAIINNECINAVPLTVNTDYECGEKTPGTVIGATGSNITSTCSGTADDDVWFRFVALAATHRVSILDINGSTADMYHALWTADCGALEFVPLSCSDAEESNPVALTPGETYYVQVYTYTATAGQTSTFNVCIGSDPTIGMEESTIMTTMGLYPNPVNDVLNIDLASNAARRVRVIDAMGRVAHEASFQRSLDVGMLQTGTYTLLAFDGDARLVARSFFVKD
ncbi:MAG: hypothetical protein JNM62_16470 [Flavobacteriales bacterium]|nr:hypothetical protein [Flavobacteriales bacterium]